MGHYFLNIQHFQYFWVIEEKKLKKIWHFFNFWSDPEPYHQNETDSNTGLNDNFFLELTKMLSHDLDEKGIPGTCRHVLHDRGAGDHGSPAFSPHHTRRPENRQLPHQGRCTITWKCSTIRGDIQFSTRGPGIELKFRYPIWGESYKFQQVAGIFDFSQGGWIRGEIKNFEA